MTGPEVYDIVGVGFGPANLALAVALTERGSSTPLRALFLDRNESFSWHPGMLIHDATMQVNFLKDLITLRNPASDFSFLSYLKARGRLVDFINHKTFFPTRVEFHDYLEWAAGRVGDVVEYGTEVVDVRPVERDGEVVYFDVVGHQQVGGVSQAVVCRARNVVVAPGLVPRLPGEASQSERVWHSSELLHRVGDLPTDKRMQFVVVGAGQSAAEVVGYLHARYECADVHAVHSRYGYSPADDTPFANRVFDPAAVEHFFHAPPSVKDKFFEYHANTNYSVVDVELIEDLYARVYRESVTERRRLHIHGMSELTEVADGPEGLRVSVRFLPDGTTTVLEPDHVVYATGYKPADVNRVIGVVAELCKRDSSGNLRLLHDYRVDMASHVRCGIYLQGGTEHSHGITSSLLSNLADRAAEILDSVLAHGGQLSADAAAWEVAS
ncbi:lysine/ornithine N-monooxygenase [Streptomyces noursei]|uniref:L-lysine N6-monooxygenase MbtG n=2 Tax=Streptomyces noursei TaxID=1971 RepID=A0A401QRP1_STRNR|nr:lysine/ornithine N-monooxygenase [Streptomyces noursei]